MDGIINHLSTYATSKAAQAIEKAGEAIIDYGADFINPNGVRWFGAYRGDPIPLTGGGHPASRGDALLRSALYRGRLGLPAPNNDGPHAVGFYTGKQHGPSPTEPFTGNPYGRKRRRASTGGIRRKASSRGRKLRRIGGRKRVIRRRSTGKRSVRYSKRGYYRGVKSIVRRRSRSTSKKSRRSTWLPPRVPLPSRSASSTFEPVDRYRAISFTGTTLNTLFYKSPLQQINSLLGTSLVANLASKAAAEFLTRYAAGSNANAKYPTGISVIQRLKMTFLPVMQLPGFVRVYAVYQKEWPDDSDRVFSTDYTTAVANAGVPQNVQANDFPYVSAGSNYYTQPHVSIKELSYLWKNWRCKKVATIKVGPGLKIKPLVFTSKLTHFNFSDLNYGGYGTPATCPRNSVKFVVETVGCNVLQDSSTQTDATIWYGPGYFKTICKQEVECVYRPTWQHAPSVSSSPTVLSITKNTNALGHITPFPLNFFGAPAQMTQHTTSGGAVVGSTAYYGVGTAPDGSAFFNNPIRIPDWDPTATGYAPGAQDESRKDKGMGVTANALKTAAT